MSASELLTFALLVGLELVLGIDNVLMLSILTSRLPERLRPRARLIGLGIALILRVLMLFGANALTHLATPLVFGLTGKGLVLVSGGLFLLFKAVKEIHHAVEKGEQTQEVNAPAARRAFGAAVVQIVLIDLVFSIDSVITAVGLTDHLLTIIAAVILSFVLVLVFASRVAVFIHRHPALKILALAFLVSIGITIVMEGFGHHVRKTYIYLPMGFALLVELLQMRQATRSKHVQE
jgi:predicted tellurium resistance membrane protein TerC